MPPWRELGQPARTIGTAISGAVSAAQATDLADFEAATTALAELPTEQTGLVLGALVRLLLEDQHIDGIDEAGIRQLLARCYQAAIGWLPPASVAIEPLVAVLSSALGIHEPGVTYQEIAGPAATNGDRVDDEWRDPELGEAAPVRGRAPTGAEYAWHSPLLIADLLSTGHRPLGRYLDLAFGEIARAENMEMP
jgi:hypothetical protein